MRKLSLFALLVVVLTERGQADSVAFEMVDLGMLGGGNTNAWKINNQGQIIGWAQIPTGDGGTVVHSWLYQDGVMTDLGTLGGEGTYSYACGINNLGQVVGYSTTDSGEMHAVLWNRVAAPVPEPATVALMGLGVLGIGAEETQEELRICISCGAVMCELTGSCRVSPVLTLRGNRI